MLIPSKLDINNTSYLLWEESNIFGNVTPYFYHIGGSLVDNEHWTIIINLQYAHVFTKVLLFVGLTFSQCFEYYSIFIWEIYDRAWECYAAFWISVEECEGLDWVHIGKLLYLALGHIDYTPRVVDAVPISRVIGILDSLVNLQDKYLYSGVLEIPHL